MNMKTSINISLLICCCLSSLMAGNADTVDVFPLQNGLQFEYNYYDFYMLVELIPAYVHIDSGSVTYTIVDSIRFTDTTCVWMVMESVHLLHKYYNGGTWYTGIPDSIYWIDYSIIDTLMEDIRNEHELLCDLKVWSFPIRDKMPASMSNDSLVQVYRYVSKSPSLLVLNLNDSYTTQYDNDTLLLAQFNGLTYRSVSQINSLINNWYYQSRHFLTATLTGISTGVHAEPSSSPKSFSLFQNYPNPFNSVTNISFDLPSKSFMSLKVYDLIGREITTLISEELPAGNHLKHWNASGLSSGVYFYRLQAGSFSETKKLVLLQ
jgi:hypothetical protein